MKSIKRSFIVAFGLGVMLIAFNVVYFTVTGFSA